MMVATKSMLDAALELAAKGLRIIPNYTIVPVLNVCTCKERDKCGCAGKHPTIDKWPDKATTDTKQIRQWWKEIRDSNIGHATGYGTVVIDVDVDETKDGLEALVRLEAEYGELPRLWVVESGSGRGQHLWFSLPDGVEAKSSDRWKPHGVEVKGLGSQVIVPPSLHESGNRYKWLRQEGDRPPLFPDRWPFVLSPASSKLPESNKNEVRTHKPHTPHITQYDVGDGVYGEYVSESIQSAVDQSLPSGPGMRNSKLLELARRLRSIDELKFKDAEDLEPIVRSWFDLALPNITTKDWDVSWREWLRIWPASTMGTEDEFFARAWRLAQSRPIPPVPDSYSRSRSLRSTVALTAAAHDLTTDPNKVWFLSCRKLAQTFELDPEKYHELCASWLRRLVKDQILEKIGIPKGRMSQEYKYRGWNPTESEQRIAA